MCKALQLIQPRGSAWDGLVDPCSRTVRSQMCNITYAVFVPACNFRYGITSNQCLIWNESPDSSAVV